MPDMRAILNASALIAGGANLSDGVYQGAGGITGVKIAYALAPEVSQMNELGPAHVSWVDDMQVDPDGGAADLTVFKWALRMQLMIAAGLADIPRTSALLMPFAPLYVAAFAANLGLKGSCSSSKLTRTPGIIQAIYPDRLALEFILIATQKESIIYAL